MAFVIFVDKAAGASREQRKIHRARWVLPIAQPPIENGWVEVEDGVVVGIGAEQPGSSDQDPARAAQHDRAILPGLVNAHTHLELSWMRNQVPPAPSMPQWVERLMALRRTVGHEPREPIAEAIREARASGTVLFGDITNTLAAYEALADSGTPAAVFRELLGFNVAAPEEVLRATRAQLAGLKPIELLRPSIVPHAPYSVSPALLRGIAVESTGARISIHLGESAEEIQFLHEGTGPWRELLRRLGVWTDEWQTPGIGPLDYVAGCGLLSERLLAVHCVQLTDAELAKLAAAGAAVVTCPRSNRWVGAGPPPVGRFYASGVRVAVGTDSLASVEDMNLFAELKLMRELAPAVPAREILASATKHGAAALGFGSEFGTIEPGKHAALIGVDVPADVTDVEEYLVGGIEPGQVSWLPA